MTLYESDLQYHLRERYSGRADEETRAKALDELAKRAQLAQAALDAELDEDPMVRAETARILSNRLREEALNPELKAIKGPISESRLREIYQEQLPRFQSKEKRQAAVLWLKPGADPERAKKYAEKMKMALDWFSKSSDLKDHPEKGFSVLSVDYSEHQASRYKGGVVGWLAIEGSMDLWSKAVAEILFSIDQPGDVSEIVERPEGIFLVRYMAQKPAVTRSFESVAANLERLEIERLRLEVREEFEAEMNAKYPVQLLDSKSTD